MQWLPGIAVIVASTLIAVVYVMSFKIRHVKNNQRTYYGIIALVFVLFLLSYAGTQTWLQYQLWNTTGVGQSLLMLPLDISVKEELGGAYRLFDRPGGYFYFYAITRFWSFPLLTIIAASVFATVLYILFRLRPSFFEKGETALLASLGLVVGFHLILIYILALFTVAVCIALMGIVLGRNPVTSIGMAAIIAVPVTYALGTIPVFYVIQTYLLLA